MKVYQGHGKQKNKSKFWPKNSEKFRLIGEFFEKY